MPTQLVFLHQYATNGDSTQTPSIDPVMANLNLRNVYATQTSIPDNENENMDFRSTLVDSESVNTDYTLYSDGVYGVADSRWNMCISTHSNGSDSRNLLAYYMVDLSLPNSRLLPSQLEYYNNSSFLAGEYGESDVQSNAVALEELQRKILTTISRLVVVVPNSSKAIKGQEYRLVNDSCPVRDSTSPRGGNNLLADPQSNLDYMFNDRGISALGNDSEIAVGLVVIQNGWDLLKNGQIGGHEIDLFSIREQCRFSDFRLNCYSGAPPADVLCAYNKAPAANNIYSTLYGGRYNIEGRQLPLHYSSIPLLTETDNDIMEPRQLVAIEDARMNAIPNIWTGLGYSGPSLPEADRDYSDMIVGIKFSKIEMKA